MNSGNRTCSSTGTEALEEDPGAYPIPFSTADTELGSRLDSISPSLRYWAVQPKRATCSWYRELVEANNRYEDWLNTQPPGAYPVPFGGAQGKRLDEIEDGLRYWGANRNCQSFNWYDSFKKANDRYEQLLATTRKPGDFPLPRGNNKEYTDMPIKSVPQVKVWWALRPLNAHEGWYGPLYDANKRMLDDKYKSRSPGSEPIWFGKRYRGYRLDQVLERKGFMDWCFSNLDGTGTYHRLKDLVERLEEWRRAHPERGGPRRRRKASFIQNPVGEAVGPWDDSPGSAGEEDEYEEDGFIQSDSAELEYATDNDEVLTDDSINDNDDSEDEVNDDLEDSDRPTTPDVQAGSSTCYHGKRKRPNVVQSDDSGEPDSDKRVGKLGKRYRVPCKDSESEE